MRYVCGTHAERMRIPPSTCHRIRKATRYVCGTYAARMRHVCVYRRALATAYVWVTYVVRMRYVCGTYAERMRIPPSTCHRLRMGYVCVCIYVCAIIRYVCVYREALAILVKKPHTYGVRMRIRMRYACACAYREALAILVRRKGTAGGVHINGWLSRGKL
jgi:hypothetical protein